MANTCAPLITVVRTNKPKGLKGLDQKVSDQVEAVPLFASRRCRVTGGQAEPNSSSVVLVRNVVSPYLSRQGK